MNSKLRIPLMPSLDRAMTKEELISMPFIEYCEYDLHTLIDDHRSIIKAIDEDGYKLGYGGLMALSDWLYEWYKKNDHYILSQRIMNAHIYALTWANNLRQDVY